MALSAKLQVRQTQSLVITPQLLQAIRLLQMSGPELERAVASEIEQNPLLECDGQPDAGPAAERPELGAAPDDMGGAAEPDAALSEAAGEAAAFEFPPAGSSASRVRAEPAARQEFGPQFDLAATESLAELLERRIDAAYRDAPVERMIALTLAASVDAAGYLSQAPQAIAERLGASIAMVERVLRRCRDWAPTGMFARDLAECLALQLAERNRLDPAMQALLSNLHRLAAGDRIALCRICGVDRDDLEGMIAEIRALDPKPGLAFGREPPNVVAPDVFVRPAPDGGWAVELNEQALPRLIVDRVYYAEVSARSRGENEKSYLANCLQKANWLERSLDQRARTVLRVASEIVRHQSGFLREGVAALRPLNLRMVADALGIHESTVSRAAANKLMATPRGTFEFRFFFSGSVAATGGSEAHSAEAVKHRIRKLILGESPDRVLSDDAIVLQLGREGIDIARRTVAKYREAMRIGSSVERRREKRLRAAS